MRRWIAAAVFVVTLAGCGGSGTATNPGRPITSPQALELARVLLGDYQHAGSRLAGTYMVQGQPLDFTGMIDFRTGTGELSLHQRSLPGQSARTYYWTRRFVLTQVAPGSSDYLVRSPNPQGQIVDHLISFLVLLSSPAIDNIELLEHSGVRYLGSSGGLDRFREGARTLVTVNHSTGLLTAIHVGQTNGATISVLLLSHGPHQITLPPRSDWRQQR